MDAVNDPAVHTVAVMTSAQIGKALALDTPLPTPEGWTTMGALAVGDMLFSETGEPCKVVFATDVMHDRPCYRVTFSDGSAIVADAEHRWQVDSDIALARGNSWHGKGPRSGIVTTQQMADTLKRGRRNNYAVRVAAALNMPAADLPIDPYALGAWLGDGNSYSPQLTLHKDDLQIADEIAAAGFAIEVRAKDARQPDVRNVVIGGIGDACWRGQDSAQHKMPTGGCAECSRLHYHAYKHGKPMPERTHMSSRLARLGVLKNKHIPAAYLRADTNQRLALLQGLMDTDGCISPAGRCEFVTTSGALAEGVAELMHSLGIKHTVKQKQPRTRYKGEVVLGKIAHRFSFMVYADKPVFRLARKLARMATREGRRTTETERRRIISVEPIDSVPVRCIQVDSESHLFLAGRAMIPTHNTEALNNVLGYYACYEPSPILVVQPTVEMAETWSKDRLAPMIRDTPALRERFSSGARASASTILHKTFPGGHVTMAGANSAASLASRPIRVVLFDEVDRYPISAGSEGDPVSLGRKRTATFWNRKVIMTSTPTVKGVSRIESEWELSDKRRYHIPCPHCGEMQILRWANVVFDKSDPKGTTVYSCVNGCVIEESHKQWMLSNGEWIAERDCTGRAGFHLNELYSPWRRWHEVVTDFLEMKGTPETLKTWTNTSLGETWEEKGEEVDHSGLLDRKEPYDMESIPSGVLLITAAVDVQQDRLEALSQGWGDEYEHWDIEHRIFWGDPAKADVWRELDQWLLQPYSVRGQGMKAACTTIDSGGHHTDHVYNFCKARQGRRVFAIKGSSQYYAPVASKPSQAGRQRVALYQVGTDTAKDTILLSWLRVPDPGPGYIHFPDTVDDEYFRQLTAEQRKTEYFRGAKRLKWSKKRERNEILDLHVYNYAAYAILQPDIQAIKARSAPKQQGPEPEQTRTTQRKRIVRPRRSWATDI